MICHLTWKSNRWKATQVQAKICMYLTHSKMAKHSANRAAKVFCSVELDLCQKDILESAFLKCVAKRDAVDAGFTSHKDECRAQ